MNIVERIDDRVPIQRVIVSVYEKQGLERFIPGLLAINPEMQFYSTGGTLRQLCDLMGEEKASANLYSISDYTGHPEMQGGLVKTLDFKIYLGLLSETYNEDHRRDLQRVSAEPFDMVVVNLYPFQKVVSNPETMPEAARANIDIGGPCMLRASAKNFIRVAPVVDPGDYPVVLEELRKGHGSLTLEFRYRLARKAFEHTAKYDATIMEYLWKTGFDRVRTCYRFE